MRVYVTFEGHPDHHQVGRQLPGVPAIGDALREDGEMYRVADVVWDTSKQGVLVLLREPIPFTKGSNES